MRKGIRRLLFCEAIASVLVVLVLLLGLLDILKIEIGKPTTAEKMHQTALMASALYAVYFLFFVSMGYFELRKTSSRTVGLLSIILTAGLMYAVVRVIILPMFV